ncbi:MAG: ACP S-malonyltransferase [Eubacteriales bacterium]
MKLGFLYAGQGSQTPGMGKDFYEAYPQFAEIMDTAPVDFDLKTCCFDGENINETQYTQPAMVAFACGITDLLKQVGIVPEVAAGLSLGEYSALAGSGVWGTKTAISIARFRGIAMTKAVEGMESAMMAILSLDREKLQVACEKASTLGVVQIANYNCPGQLVIGGEKAAVEQAAVYAKELGARRALPLKVSGPFHTSLLEPASKALHDHFATITFGDMAYPILFNCLGDEKETDTSIANLLERQVMSSVYLEDSIRAMAAMGVDTIIEIGPGKVLSGFVKKTCPEITTYAISSVEDFVAVKEAFSC